ncbi:hypothetical protein VC83_08025 [Pseudogymnoascus destructans]|uniref:Uncharacterized protein n=2 Tax=Pseudogymnoascus destructans TaxID=655981 RepID=L8G6B4_PSED2|nr:uncharacterized protein VC83_08025 [Pseudogymnoascus destructans]ELR08213.1 hypothetical protein GMDG_03023 [Pseudogymnoascus destructans 20631-21]OAF55950.1 hypothetical protein VC83_08025 [Pseudogymnoascus destructans]
MDLSSFLNPVDEDIQELEGWEDFQGGDAILEDIMSQYVPDTTQDDEEEDEPSSQPVPTTQAVINAIQVLIEFTESGNSDTSEAPTFLRSFECFERQLRLLEANSQRQGTLDSWFM